ncbi:hypothetical protein CTI12_AA419250 [Artemisia annua]|uniref:Uncharacterized protein n=1 Tax=Artemisia annua TaxID=35608 RepID=A0A2U1M573_ARTAN|nr:hypothetical protein CTI12_AA419250 [Artemisia annua]
MGMMLYFLFQRERDANLSDGRDLKKVYDEVEARMRYMGFIITKLEQMFGNDVVHEALTPLRLCQEQDMQKMDFLNEMRVARHRFAFQKFMVMNNLLNL